MQRICIKNFKVVKDADIEIMTRMRYTFFYCGLVLLSLIYSPPLLACDVLVVMSYHEDMPRVQEIRQGIEEVLQERCQTHYAYLDARQALQAAPAKAQQAFEFYQELQPDGVIAVDNEAQQLFVVPYLKDKVATPVIFCGVNMSAEDYGYPASNLTGVMERLHIAESIAFVQQLDMSIRTIGVLMKAGQKANDIWAQMEAEADMYSATLLPPRMVTTLSEAVQATRELREQSDALFLASLDSLRADDGTPLTAQKCIPSIADTFGKPLLGPNERPLQFGALCAVVEIVEEQGSTAASMLLQIFDGTPIAELPIVQNRKGKRMLNVTRLKALGIKPKPHVLQGVEFIQSQP